MGGACMTDRLDVGDEMRATVENCSAYAHFFGTFLPSSAVTRCSGRLG